MVKTNRFLEICVDGVRSLRPYLPGKPISELEREYGVENIIKLASNENPLGPPRKSIEAMRRILDDLAQYPDSNGFELKGILAEKHQVDNSQVILGNGSENILEIIARVFLGPGKSAVFSRYAFAVYPIVTQAVGAEAHVADANAPDANMPYGHNLDAIAALVDSTTRVVFIANPNNPTGTWLNETSLVNFVEALPKTTVVVIDEAYFDYVSGIDGYPDMSRYLADYDNLVVSRTFSKAFGLAGLRIGYALANEGITDLLNRVRAPFNTSAVALAAAAAALNDADHLEKSISVNRGGLKQLGEAFQDMGLEFIPSVGNFITVDMGEDAAPIYEKLLRAGIIVRPVANYGLPNHLRVTVGLPAQNQRLIAALRRIIRR